MSESRVVQPLERGHVEVSVGPEGQLTVVHFRRVFGRRVREPNAAGRLALVGGLLMVLGALASLSLGSWWGMLLALWPGAFAAVGLWRLVDRHSFRPFVVDVAHRRVVMGGRSLQLDEARVRLHPRGWELVDRTQRIDVGHAWGAAGAAWLDRLLRRSRQGRLDPRDLGDIPHAARAPRIVPAAKGVFRFDHGGLVGELAPLAPQESLTPSTFHLLALLVMFVFCLALWPSLSVILMLTGYVGTVLVEMASVVQKRRRRHRLGHSRIRIDGRGLEVTVGGRGERVQWASVVEVYRGRRALHLRRRNDATLTVGHGWSFDSLAKLHDHVDEAWRSADKAPESPSDVPEALARLQRKAQSE